MRRKGMRKGRWRVVDIHIELKDFQKTEMIATTYLGTCGAPDGNV